MSNPADIAGTHRADVIPGWIMSRPGAKQIIAAEDHFRRQYINTVVEGMTGAGVPGPVLEKVLMKVADDVKQYAIGYGSIEFDLWATAVPSRDLLTFLSLQVKHADITMEKVREFYDGANGAVIHRATLDLWGYPLRLPSKKAEGAASGENGTGPTSSGDSAAPNPAGSE